MAVQGASINRSYGRGLHPAVKVPRNKKGEPGSALIEKQHPVTGHSGRDHNIQIFGLDGVTGIKTVANGEELFVPLVPKALREPRPGCIQAFFEIPEHRVIHPDLQGREVMVRLDGYTERGLNRSQYIRWIHEHSEAGRAILGLREGTESEHSTIKRMLPWKRARSYGELNNTLDTAGYYFMRNVKAALAHERRTGHMPMRIDRPPGQPHHVAA